MSTVANICGGTAHISPLLRKTRGLGLVTSDHLLQVAVASGCTHYAPVDYRSDNVIDPGVDKLSDVELELGIALISGTQIHDLKWMGCAGKLLNGSEMDPEYLERRARMDRCAPALVYIATQGRQLDEIHGASRADLLDRLPLVPVKTAPLSRPCPRLQEGRS